MFKRCATHARRLLVVAFATTLECLAASNIHAQSERTQNFQDRCIEAQAPHAAIQRTFPSLQSCGDVDFGTGDQSCGSLTGGPSGGNSNRN